jgi:hypothetical protein
MTLRVDVDCHGLRILLNSSAVISPLRRRA